MKRIVLFFILGAMFCLSTINADITQVCCFADDNKKGDRPALKGEIQGKQRSAPINPVEGKGFRTMPPDPLEKAGSQDARMGGEAAPPSGHSSGNPQTGEPLQIPASVSVGFKPGAQEKDRLDKKK